jgi:hypothetical protein
MLVSNSRTNKEYKMKKIAIYIATALLTLGTPACSDFLGKEVDLSLSDEQVFSSFENTRGFLANIYTYLPDAFAGYTNGQFLAASRDCMTDNSVSFWDVHYYNSVLTDGYSSKDHPFAKDFWPKNFKGIRATNQFMKNARESVIGNSDKSGDENRLYDRYMAEARLLRAIFHFDVACWFGDVPIIGNDENGDPIIFDPADTEAMNMARTNSADALKWIADECDAIKDKLPFRYSNEDENWGRVNGATAYALKSRALLYRASALHNPNKIASYWQEAATAAQEFLTKNNSQSNRYKLYTTSDNDTKKNYYECFVTTPYYNDEYILTRSVWNTYEIELFLAPCGFSGTATAVGRTNPTQNFVDSYETINGLPIDQDPTYNEQNPYANRDPRLEQTILHHGSVWGDALQEEQREVDVSTGGKDKRATHGGTLTGYYTKKFLNNMSFKSPSTYNHVCPIFRYGEILLNAAEAINEASGPDQAYQYVNQVRARVGMPAYKGMTQDQLRERIRNERRIELSFEDHRFFDERRWKLFEGQSMSSERSLPRYKQLYNLYGVVVTPDASTVYTYGSAEARTSRAFNSPKNYYFPIPDSDVKKAPNLKQNPGWELSATE